MRFLLDASVSVRVAEWLRSQGHDAVHLRERGLQALPDEEVFEKARTEGRVLLAFDLDFGGILSWTRAARPSVVLFRLRNARFANVVARLADVLSRSEDALGQGSIVVVEESCHRVRPLPIGRQPPAEP